MKEITVHSKTYGTSVVLCDDEDYDALNGNIYVKPNSGKTHYYAWFKNGPEQWKGVSRVLMNPPDGMVVDHRDGNTLNNQKINLRTCTVRENSRNSKRHKDSNSPFKGVRKNRDKWVATVSLSLGTFTNPEDAARAYDNAIVQLHGEFARTNFPIKP